MKTSESGCMYPLELEAGSAGLRSYFPPRCSSSLELSGSMGAFALAVKTGSSSSSESELISLSVLLPSEDVLLRVWKIVTPSFSALWKE
ncbi:hypothetical protein QQP08_014838 [Theobroma cacao]|nr:hypothetical protein QQP08_014838 [Theobroma cacao]